MDERAFDLLVSAVSGKADLGEAWRRLFEAAKAGSLADKSALLGRLDPLIRRAPVETIGPVALLAGALVEIGGEPAAFPLSLFDRLGRFLDDVPAHPPVKSEEEDEDGAKPYELPDAYFQCERAAAAVLSRSVELRRTLPHKASLLGKIHRYQERYGFLSKMLSVLDDEPLIVLHPSTRRGWAARMGGIADNFQLHLLLRAALAGGGPERIAGEPPPPAAIRAASDGDPSDAPTAVSDWQLANWPAVRDDGSLPGQSDTRHWIWNEGFPAEVEPFAGTRLIAVGPSTIQRSWNSERVFAGMHGWLRVERALTGAEASTLLAEIAAARSAG
jgi:hypothetical protein